MAAVTSCKNTLLVGLKTAVKSNVTACIFSIFSDFQPFDLDSFLESLHQSQQQEQQDQ